MEEHEITVELHEAWSFAVMDELTAAGYAARRTVVRSFDGEEPVVRIAIQVAGRAIWAAVEKMYSLFRDKKPAPAPDNDVARVTLTLTNGDLRLSLSGASIEEAKNVINAIRPR